MKRTSIMDLAREAQVSSSAVSMALNGRSSVSEATRQAVLAAAEKLGYERLELKHRSGPRPGKPMPRKKRQANLVFAIDDSVNMAMPVYMDLFQGIQDEAGARNCNLSLCRFSDGRIAPQDGVNGYIVLGGKRVSAESALPMVGVMGGSQRYGRLDQVSYDNTVIGALAAEHLLRQGRRNLAVFSFSDPANVIFGERTEVFRRFAEAGGARVDVHETTCYEMLDSTFEKVMGQAGKYDGVFSTADMITVKLYMLFSRHGYSPVRDFDLVSCNNELQLVSTFTPPPVEIDIHARQVGRRAVDLLLRRLEKPSEPHERITIMPELIVPNRNGN